MPGRPGDSILPRPFVFLATFAVATGAWSLAAWLWSSGNRALAISVFALGLSLGPCLTAYVTAPRALKTLQRRIVLIAGGLGILAPPLLGLGSLDLEAFLVLLLVLGIEAGGSRSPVGERR